MAGEVTAELMVADASRKLSDIAQNMFPPRMSGAYNYASSVASKLDSFLSDVNLSSDCDGSIDYIIPAVVAGGADGSTSDSPELVLAYLDPSKLADQLGATDNPTNTTIEPTVFVLPSLADLTMPPVPTLLTPPSVTQGYDKSARFTSAYLTTVATYVTGLSNGAVPQKVVDSLLIASEKLEYDLDLALDQVLAETAAKGFRKPNSMTTYQMREIYQKYFTTVEGLCTEFTDTTFALLAGAKQLGISAEQVQIDFTTHLNELALAITAFQIKRYEDLIADSIARYNAAVSKANARVAESDYRVKRSLVDVQDMLLSLSAKSTSNGLAASHAKNLLAFADVYRDGNKGWLKEKQQNAQIETFNIQSEQSKTILDLEAEIKGFTLSSEVIKSNTGVLRDKLTILKNDLDAYATMADAMPLEVQQASADFDLLYKEFQLKLVAMGRISTVLAGSGSIIESMLKADIKVKKTKGVA